MASPMKILGMRVLRGPDWDQNEADGGEGHLGTLVGVKIEDGTTEVVWDNGQVTTCRVGKEGKHDLRIYDDAPAGECASRGVVCQGCRNSSIYGTSWRCSTCSNLHLCSRCYHLGVHSLSHHFLRRDNNAQQGTAVGARSEATRVQVYGMFPEARVARGRDWQAGDVDGGSDAGGVVVEVVSPESGSARNAVRVSWDSGQSLQHRLGLHGKVDLVCTEEAPGPACYVSHLPVLALMDGPFARERTPAATSGPEVKQVIQSEVKGAGATGNPEAAKKADVNNVTTEDMATARTKAEVKQNTKDIDVALDTEGEIGVGDRVEVGVDFDTFRDIQTQAASWTHDMAGCFGGVGVVKEVTGLGNVKVTFGDDTWTLCPISLRKTTKSPTAAGSGRKERPKIGDKVRIISDVTLLEQQQQNHGGWVRDMTQAAGKVGTVLTINVKGDVVVQFGQRHWIFNPDSCTPAPGCSVDFIPADSSDGLLEGLKRHLEDLLPSDDAVLDAASSPRLRELFTAIKAGDAAKLTKLLEVDPELVRETAREATALHYAAFRGNVEAVRLLVAKGASVNKGDKNDDTPLIRAIHRRQTDTARVLIELGADVNLSNENGRTPLHSAVVANSIDLVRLLLHNMASVNRRDIEGDPPLFDALQIDNLDPAIVDILLATGDLDLSIVNKKGFNALHMAALKDRARAAERILARDSSLLTSVMEDERYTALHIACANDHVDVIKVLLKAKAPLDPRSHQLATPLHLACSEDYMMSARILVENGADVNAVDVNWDTPLHECFSESKNPAKQLLGTSARGPNKGLELAKFLLQHGARHFLRNRQGKTALDVAPESVREKLTSFLNQPNEDTSPKTEKPPNTRENPDKTPSNEASSFASKCATCHQREADVIFLPCAHKLVCRQCAGSTKSCRECGMDIKSKVDTKGRALEQTTSHTTGHTFEEGDIVRVISDVKELERLQRKRGGWVNDIAQAAGKVGKVMKLDADRNIAVYFGQIFWIFNPDSCVPAPGCSPDVLPLRGLFEQFGVKENEANRNIAKMLGIDLDAMMEQTCSFLTQPSPLLELYYVIGSGNAARVLHMLEQNPGLVHQKMSEATVLHYAAFSGETDIARIIVSKGGDVNEADGSGHTPLIRAVYRTFTETARVLIELGSDVNRANHVGTTALHVAVAENCMDIVRLLLQHGACVNSQDLSGQTPLYLALAASGINPDILDVLLAVPDVNLKLTTSQSATFLHTAAHFRAAREVEKILTREPSLVNAVMEKGSTPLHLATRNNRIDSVRVLLKAGATVNAKEQTGLTALHSACSKDYGDIAGVLLENGADLNVVDSAGNTPLHLCVGCYSSTAQYVPKDKGLELAKVLIRHGARADALNKKGQTPLDMAQDLVQDGLRRFLQEGTWIPEKNENNDEICNETPRSASVPPPGKCVTCHQREADVIFLPCAHKLFCRQCAGSTKTCRECGKDVAGRVDTKGNAIQASSASPSPAAASQGNAEAQVQECKVQ